MTEHGDGEPGDGDSTDEEDDVVEMYGPPGGTAPGETTPSSTDDGEGNAEDTTADAGANLDAPLLGGDEEEMEEITGRFYVKHTEDVAVTLHEIDSEQIVTLIENPDLETHQIIDATLAENPPLGVSYIVEEIHSQETIPVEDSEEPPTRQVERIASDMEINQAVAIEREGEGEIHVLRVEPDNVTETAEGIEEDETTYKNAARYGIDRVEVRTDDADGIVSIRYLPS
jgi:hypothetical protein